MLLSNIELLKHIQDEILFVLKTTSGKNKDEFISDPVLSRAVIRSLEIIGEASTKLSPGFKAQYPDVEWRKISDTRNRLIHDYFGVDYDIVWNIITDKLPDLKENIQNIITENP
ncbi:HepT-like ribonuclease domain-containing protein [Sinomicrobium sp. M5D2P9]